MSPSDRSDGKEPGRDAPGGAPSDVGKPEPIERSSRGRILIRSSSHPPVSERGGSDARDVSGARSLPGSERPHAPDQDRDEGADARSKRSTPAERPRRRRKIQAARAAADPAQDVAPARVTGVERPHRFGPGLRRSTPERIAVAEAANAVRARRRRIAIGVAIAILLAAALWAALQR